MADNETPTDDLRTLLSASFDESAKAAAPEPVVEAKPVVAEVEPKADPVEIEPKDGDRARGPDGKFLKKDDEKQEAKAEAKPKEEPKPEVKAEEKQEDKPAEAKPADGKGAPENWSASDKAMFKLQSAEAQDFLLRRHKAMEADYTKKLAPLADLKKEYEPVQQLFAPHLDVLKQKGLTPQSVIRRWADVETALANGKGIDIISGLVKGYGIDKAALGKALGFTSTPAEQQSTDQTAGSTYTDPTAQLLERLEQKIAQSFAPKLAKIDQWEQAQQNERLTAAQQREAKVESDITNFKSAASPQGELLHPYYEEVEPAMVALASSYVASKQPIPPLAELYETAVWANPSTRAALLASQKQAEQLKANEEARAKAASARRAASSVTGAPGSGQSSRPVRAEISLREQLEEAAADLG
jgi:hypothetical protein